MKSRLMRCFFLTDEDPGDLLPPQRKKKFPEKLKIPADVLL